MNEQTEARIGTIAAFLVLFSAMLDPRISAAMAVVFLLALAGYHWYAGRGKGARAGN
jgi:hypothetical protein